jgi:hypothetical protein
MSPSKQGSTRRTPRTAKIHGEGRMALRAGLTPATRRSALSLAHWPENAFRRSVHRAPGPRGRRAKRHSAFRESSWFLVSSVLSLACLRKPRRPCGNSPERRSKLGEFSGDKPGQDDETKDHASIFAPTGFAPAGKILSPVGSRVRESKLRASPDTTARRQPVMPPPPPTRPRSIPSRVPARGRCSWPVRLR